MAFLTSLSRAMSSGRRTCIPPHRRTALLLFVLAIFFFSRPLYQSLGHFVLAASDGLWSLAPTRLRSLIMATRVSQPLPAADHSESCDADVELLTHRMVHLKTKEECRQGNETLQVWTVELPSKHAEGILKAVKENVSGQDIYDLQHLRRFAKPRYLPKHVLGKPNKIKELYSVPRTWNGKPETAMQEPTTTVWEWSTGPKPRANATPPTLHLLICPTALVSFEELHALLLQQVPFTSSSDSWAYPLEIKEITVPKLTPTSPAQAAAWSEQYWPTFYRKTNPFGAHPSIIAKAEQELHYPADGNIGVEELMALATHAGLETKVRDIGVGPGAVIVERLDEKTEVVAVAGDARFGSSQTKLDSDSAPSGCSGNIMNHSVMRAIGMVGRKRLRVASPRISTKAAKAERNFANCGLDHDENARDAFFLDLPVTPVERHYFERDNIKPDGYLCLRLEVVLTHEPCVMCSMALVHSRVGRVIFANRMPSTGGLTSETARNDTGPIGLGYGLCWRKELNWQFSCWQYKEAEQPPPNSCKKENGQVGAVGRVPVSAPLHTSSNTSSFTSSLNSISTAPQTQVSSADRAVSAKHEANLSSSANLHA